MAVCNIFKELTKNTGTFFTFSQYMEDLTAWQTESKYRKIIPSKFVAMDINPSEYNNESFARMLQVRFENACACFKNLKDEKGNIIDWVPEYAKTLFWNSMFDSGLLTPKSENGDLPGINEIKYVGDINIQSYNDVDNMGYSEIYCHIPNNEPSYLYNYSTVNLPQYKIDLGETKTQIDGIKISKLPWDESNKEIEIIETSTESQTEYVYNNLEGFNDGDLEDNAEKLTEKEHEYIYKLFPKYTFSWDDADLGTEVREDTSFNINAVIVLYDIYNDGNILYQGVPMGIYITGLIDEGEIQNSITKFVTNEDIYNSGTSYGLRICSRYVVASEQDSYVESEVSYENNNYNELTKVLSQLSISQNKMDDIVNKKFSDDQKYKELLSIFTTSKTNVPYIKTIDGNDYWFVNGKLISEISQNSSSDSNCIPYDNNELDEYIGYDELAILSSIQFNAGSQSINYGSKKIILDKTNNNTDEGKAKEIYIYWQAMYQNRLLSYKTNKKDICFRLLSVDESNNTEILCDDYSQEQYLINPDVNKRNLYRIKLGYDAKTAISPLLSIQYVYPTYFGHSGIDYANIDNNAIGINEFIETLDKHLIGSRTQSYIVTSPESENMQHLYLIYPKEFGELTSILDEDNRNYMPDFKKYELNINGIDYYLYMDEKGPVSVQNKIIYFK